MGGGGGARRHHLHVEEGPAGLRVGRLHAGEYRREVVGRGGERGLGVEAGTTLKRASGSFSYRTHTCSPTVGLRTNMGVILRAVVGRRTARWQSALKP